MAMPRTAPPSAVAHIGTARCGGRTGGHRPTGPFPLARDVSPVADVVARRTVPYEAPAAPAALLARFDALAASLPPGETRQPGLFTGSSRWSRWRRLRSHSAARRAGGREPGPDRPPLDGVEIDELTVAVEPQVLSVDREGHPHRARTRCSHSLVPNTRQRLPAPGPPSMRQDSGRRLSQRSGPTPGLDALPVTARVSSRTGSIPMIRWPAVRPRLPTRHTMTQSVAITPRRAPARRPGAQSSQSAQQHRKGGCSPFRPRRQHRG